jgi:hypothetical protein
MLGHLLLMGNVLLSTSKISHPSVEVLMSNTNRNYIPSEAIKSVKNKVYIKEFCDEICEILIEKDCRANDIEEFISFVYNNAYDIDGLYRISLRIEELYDKLSRLRNNYYYGPTSSSIHDEAYKQGIKNEGKNKT